MNDFLDKFLAKHLAALDAGAPTNLISSDQYGTMENLIKVGHT